VADIIIEVESDTPPHDYAEGSIESGESNLVPESA
jgi:hypothetical protein